MTVLANVLQPMIDILEDVLVFLHNDVGFGWGMSIVMLTVVVRLVIMPLTVKQFRSMQMLQRLQPQIKEIQAKYKDDRQRMNQEMMRFYQENKVNPFSSCLPLLLQLPVFFALFYLLRQDLAPHLIETKGWLFISDLTKVPTGTSLGILIALYLVSQVASSVLMTTTADKRQQQLMIALPVVFVVFIIQFPSGLIVYWITTNLWTVVQQLFLKRLAVTHPLPVSGRADAVTEAKAPPPPPRRKKKRSGRQR